MKDVFKMSFERYEDEQVFCILLTINSIIFFLMYNVHYNMKDVFKMSFVRYGCQKYVFRAS